MNGLIRLSSLIFIATMALSACGDRYNPAPPPPPPPPDTTAPTTALTNPNGGDSWGGTRNVTWSTTDANPGTVDIWLSSDSGASYATMIATATPDTGAFSWDTSAVADGATCRIQITATDSPGNVGAPVESAADFSIDNTLPTIVLTSPNGGEAWDGSRSVTWSTTDTNIGTADIRLSSDSGGSYPTVLAASAPDTGTFSWDTSIVADAATYRIQVTPIDAAANAGTPAESVADFTVDNAPPTVSGFARYTDENTNSIADAGDKLVIPFDRAVAVNGASDTDFTLPVSGDSLGAGATVAAGPATNEVTITLGTSPSLKSRQTFDAANTAANDPSGIDIGAVLTADAIENNGGVDAVQSTPLDITPAFVDSGQALGGGRTWPAVLGDVDGDGDRDIVAGNFDNQPNRVWLNDGTGTFTDSGQTLGNTFTLGIALGDVDGDGDGDIVTGIFGQPNRVWLNQGGLQGGTAGTFTDSGQTLGSSNTRSVVLGDVDADGDRDIVAGNAGQNRIWLNQGGLQGGAEGTFSDSGQALGGNATTSIVLGDVDSDGDPDIVAGNDGNSANQLWLNDGTGIFTAGQGLGTSSTLSIVLGDIDSDGDRDIIAGNYDQPNRVWRNDGAGTFTDSGQALGSSLTISIEIGDVDGDGDRDIVVGNDGPPNRVWLNDGTGTFADSAQALGTNSTKSIGLGDLDGDGDLDIVTGNDGQGNRVYLNSLSGTSGTATFTDSGQVLGSSDTRSIVVGDVDGDGDRDIVTGTFGQANRVWRNDGTGAFTDSGQGLGSSPTVSIALGDIDGDGDRDIVAGNFGQPNRVWLNDGTGIFADSGQALGSSSTRFIVLGDVDGDGDRDIITGNDGGQPNRVWLNDGTGTFTDSGQALGSSNTYSVRLGDVDGDGDHDIIAANHNNQRPNRVYLNDGTGTFTDSGQALGSSQTRSIVLGDVDGDGDLDFVAANDFGQPNRVWLNDGTGTFTDSLQALASSGTLSIVLGDVDGDGDLDFAVGNGGPNRVWLNDGTGTFTDSGQALGSSSTNSIALGDVDGDGDRDIVAGNCCSTPNRVWLNQ